ncbi:predicted protein [Histoplasma capsulatum H143]|uniref:Uncharacterized protein n=1 Tax=Ajellomyces capsulatus (strain H143) TaxID=544712 RepID=C6H4B7_AJECH|nr:predicted protein [Histoplasma capsulatum H143]
MTKPHFFQQVPHVVTETEARKDIAWYRSGDNNYNDIDEIELQKDMNFNEYWSRTVHREKSKEPMPTNGKAHWSHSRGARRSGVANGFKLASNKLHCVVNCTAISKPERRGVHHHLGFTIKQLPIGGQFSTILATRSKHRVLLKIHMKR